MFQRIRSRLDDMKTIKSLCESAEAYALEDRQREPGAEHFLLAALDLPDGTARLAFSHAGVEPDGLKAAIEGQYGDALRAIGLTFDAPVDDPDMPAMSRHPGAYQAAPSGQEVMQALAATRIDHGPLLGAHVVRVVAGMAHGVAARSLRTLGADAAVLKSSAEAVARSGRAV